MSWNYDMQGPFERTDQLCNRGNVWDVKEALASIHPATGLPIQFNVSRPHPYEMQLSCRGEGMRFVDGCGSPYVAVRVPNPDSYDRIIRRYGDTYVQMLDDGGIARWITWPVGWQAPNLDGTRWVGLWRIEYPDGRIVRPMPSFYSPEQAYWSYLQAENGKDGTRVTREDGTVVLVDGGGVEYARLIGDRMYPNGIIVQTGRDTVQYESTFPTGKFYNQQSDLRSTDFRWFRQSSWYNSAEMIRLRKLLQPSQSTVQGLKPSEVLLLYYSVGAWEDLQVKISDLNYSLARYRPGFGNPYLDTVPHGADGTEWAMRETDFRKHLYLWRPDLHVIRLGDGTPVPGLIDWSLFPPLDGVACFRKAKSGMGGFLEKAFGIASMALTAAIPGIGGVIIGLGMTYANLRDKQKAMAEQLRMVGEATQFMRLTQGTQQGVYQIVTMDPPRADILDHLEDRAGGESTPPPTPTPAGSSLWIIAGLAVLSVL